MHVQKVALKKRFHLNGHTSLTILIWSCALDCVGVVPNFTMGLFGGEFWPRFLLIFVIANKRSNSKKSHCAIWYNTDSNVRITKLLVSAMELGDHVQSYWVINNNKMRIKTNEIMPRSFGDLTSECCTSNH